MVLVGLIADQHHRRRATRTAGYTGDNGPATSAKLNGPNRVALDSLGDLFITDNNNNVVRKVNKATGESFNRFHGCVRSGCFDASSDST